MIFVLEDSHHKPFLEGKKKPLGCCSGSQHCICSSLYGVAQVLFFARARDQLFKSQVSVFFFIYFGSG